MEIKYLVVQDGNLEIPFMFPCITTHAEIARALGRTVLSAGFCSPVIKRGAHGEYVKWNCYGESVSLNVSSRGDADSVAMAKMFTR